jgi:hypothetical protein
MTKEDKELTTTEDEQKALMATFEGEGMGDGFENVTENDLKPNFLRIAQSTTDCAKKGHDSYVAGFEPGIFYDTVTKTNMGETVKAVVLGYFTNYVEWGKELGDFKGSYTQKAFEEIKNTLAQFVDDDGKMHPSKWVTPNNTYVVETKNYFVFLPEYKELDILLCTMSGAAISQSKEWITKMSHINVNGKRPPMYATVWELGLVMDENSKGSWYALGKKGNSKIKNLGFVPVEDRAEVIAKRKIVAEWINESKSVNYAAAAETTDDVDIDNQEF